MNDPHPSAADRLGGRLELLPVDQLDEDQARYRDQLVASRGAEAVTAGFEMVLPACRLTRALAVEHAVSDELYAQAEAAFGPEKLMALVNVIGRYMSTAAVLACFRVPAP
jgi:hypothetical protein